MFESFKMWLAAAVTVCSVGYFFLFGYHPALHPAPGVAVAPDIPEQSNFSTEIVPLVLGSYTLTPRADYAIEARIVGVERYAHDGGSVLSPVDYAVAWGRMSDSAILDQLHISQGGRFYSYSWRNQPPLPSDEMVRSSANMHLIPADERIRSRLLRARVGQVARLTGKLVDVAGPDGFSWHTSLTREDSGNGACELMLVESVELLERH